MNTVHKGRDLLKNISNILNSNYYIKVFGINNNALPQNFYPNNVKLLGEYDNSNIFEILKREQIDIFLFVSIFEETYSFTLSIAMQTGLPILYNNIGAYEERLTGRNNTFQITESNINNILQLLKTKTTNNSHILPTEFKIYNHNADWNYILYNNNNINFKTELIKNHIKHKNVCFIHLTNIGNGYSIFIEQIEEIKKHGLYQKLDFIFIILLGKHIKLPNDPKLKVIYYSSNKYEWEWPSIKLIKLFADNINIKVNILYIHTKGVLRKNNSTEWRKYLQYFLINNYTTCLHYLNNNFDCVGTNINIHPQHGPNKTKIHFSETFLSNSNYNTIKYKFA